MKTISLLSTLLLLQIVVFSQITINSTDFGSIGDNIRYSNSELLSSSQITATGANYNWDFSNLIATSQFIDKYVSVYSTGLVYNMAFLGKSNLVSPRPDMGMMSINITEAYNFFKKDNNVFKIVGAGGKANGTPVPIVFTNPDIKYRFPMAFGNIDSSDSDWDVNMPGVGYIEQDLHRVNHVDGWGTITTPYGSFTCLRLKSVVFQDDSVYLTSSGFGMRLPQNYTEYTWFAKGMNFPIMQATVNLTGVSIFYIDSLRSFVGTENRYFSNSNSLTVSPNPATDKINIKTDFSGEFNIAIFDLTGKIVFQKKYSSPTQIIDISTMPKSIYLLKAYSKDGILVRKFIVE